MFIWNTRVSKKLQVRTASRKSKKEGNYWYTTAFLTINLILHHESDLLQMYKHQKCNKVVKGKKNFASK